MHTVKIHHSRPGAIIRITGEDAASYLQSQFSNDLNREETTPVTYGLLLNRKGKIQADAFILQLDINTFLAVSYFCSSEHLRTKLEDNIIADDVELTDVAAEYEWFVLLGASAAHTVEKLFAAPAADAAYLSSKWGWVWPGRHAAEASFDLLVPRAEGRLAAVLAHLKTLDINGVVIDKDELATERIRAKIPAIPFDLTANDLPQEGGLERCAVSFNKGCYLGQEVMARLHAMGKAQRSLVQIKSQHGISPLPQTLYVGQHSVGEVRSVAAFDGTYWGLALVKNRHVKSGMQLALGPNKLPEIEVSA